MSERKCGLTTKQRVALVKFVATHPDEDVKIIKRVRTWTGYGLKQAKDCVDYIVTQKNDTSFQDIEEGFCWLCGIPYPCSCSDNLSVATGAVPAGFQDITHEPVNAESTQRLRAVMGTTGHASLSKPAPLSECKGGKCALGCTNLWHECGRWVVEAGNYKRLCDWQEAGCPDDPTIPFKYEEAR